MTQWIAKIDLTDIWPDGPVSGQKFIELRDTVVKRLRKGPTYLRQDLGIGVGIPLHLINNLAACQDADEFDTMIDKLYNHADRQRIWIATLV
jgi:hypothetical protein